MINGSLSRPVSRDAVPFLSPFDLCPPCMQVINRRGTGKQRTSSEHSSQGISQKVRRACGIDSQSPRPHPLKAIVPNFPFLLLHVRVVASQKRASLQLCMYYNSAYLRDVPGPLSQN